MNRDAPGGYAGHILRVDLTSGKTWSHPWTPDDMRVFVGGAGLGAKILWDEVPAGVAWDHPENRLILATGPLAGLPVWGTGGLSVVTRGAMTNGGASTQANGFFGACLKYSGYDAIVVQGQSSGWVYLYIQDGVGELRRCDVPRREGHVGDPGRAPGAARVPRAPDERLRHRSGWGEPGALFRHRRGLRPRRQQERLRRRHGKEAAQGGGHRPGHAGDPGRRSAGPLPGRGRDRPRSENQSDDQVLVRVRNAQWCPESQPNRRPAHQELHDQCGPRGHRHGGLGGSQPARRVRSSGPSVQRLRDAPLPHAGDPDRPPSGTDRGRARVRRVGGGRLGHRLHGSRGHLVAEHPGGPRRRGRERVRLAGRLGDGMPGARLSHPRPTGGSRGPLGGRGGGSQALADDQSPPRFRKRPSGRREAGCGNGGRLGGCVRHLHRKGGVTSWSRPPRAMGGDAGYDHQQHGDAANGAARPSGGVRDAGPHQPLRSGGGGEKRRRTPWATPLRGFPGRLHLHDAQPARNMCRALSAATGWEFTKAEAVRQGRRTAALFRAFDLRCGIGPDLEWPSARYGSIPVDGPAKGRAVQPNWERMVDVWYETVGYDRKTGRPQPDTLRTLGLEFLIPSLWGT